MSRHPQHLATLSKNTALPNIYPFSALRNIYLFCEPFRSLQTLHTTNYTSLFRQRMWTLQLLSLDNPGVFSFYRADVFDLCDSTCIFSMLWHAFRSLKENPHPLATLKTGRFPWSKFRIVFARKVSDGFRTSRFVALNLMPMPICCCTMAINEPNGY